jgi:hypothetical protein
VVKRISLAPARNQTQTIQPIAAAILTDMIQLHFNVLL